MSYRQHNPKGISAPIEEWTHQDLVTWISWCAIQALTSGQTLDSAMFQVPHIVIQWHKANEARNAEEKRPNRRSQAPAGSGKEQA